MYEPSEALVYRGTPLYRGTSVYDPALAYAYGYAYIEVPLYIFSYLLISYQSTKGSTKGSLGSPIKQILHFYDPPKPSKNPYFN